MKTHKRALAGLVALAAVMASLPVASTAADDGPDRVVVLLLDGSGSISAADWTLQLSGYSSTVTDREVVPTDGSVAVGIVQWASSTTRTEIAPTVIDSPLAASSLAAQMSEISQIGGNTNPGDGIRAGTDELLAAGFDDSRWTLCMSTDGPRNAGESLASATAYARASGVERYSVIGIADAGASLPSLAAHYGPHVFADGDAGFVGARDTLEFTSFVSGCFLDPVEITAIEVNQAVQDLENSVPLVAHKRTAVRVYAQTADGTQRRTTGRLHGSRNGIALPESPLQAMGYSSGTATIDGSTSTDRGSIDATLNFALPPSWRHGDVTLRIEAPGGQHCADSGLSASCPTPEVGVVFQDGSPQDVKMVAVQVPDHEGTVRAPSDVELDELRARVDTVLPVPHVGDLDHGFMRRDRWWQAVGRRPSNKTTWLMLLDDLADYALWNDGCAWPVCDTRYYAALPGDRTSGPSGYATGNRPFVLFAGGYTFDATSTYSIHRRRNLVGHEIGHTLGLDHAVHSDAPRAGLPGLKYGFCGEDAQPFAADWPHLYTYRTASGQDRTVHAIGPVDGDEAIWGLDTRFWPPLPASAEVSLALSDPTQVFSLMGYCGPANEDSQQLWISKKSYEEVAARTGVSAALATQSTAPMLMVSGLIDVSEDDHAAVFSPVYTHDGMVADETPDGDYMLELIGADDEVVASRTFMPSVPGEATTFDEDDEVDEPDPLSFRLAIPVPSQPLTEAVIWHDGVEIGRLKVGGTTPQLSELSVDTSSADDVTFSWQVEEPDGDPVRFVVRYSPDGGGTWEALGVSLEGQQITVPRRFLAGSPNAVFDVHVSDGLNDSRVVSDPFELAGNAPRITVRSPPEGAAFVGHQLVPLEAHAVDREDGPLTGAAVTWTSDLDGSLGIGTGLWIDAANLSEGMHRITATATDSSGATASDSITITIGRLLQPEPPDTIDLALDRLGSDVEAAGLNKGIERSLLAKLISARRALEADDPERTCRMLAAFSSEVSALVPQHLTGDNADDLTSAAHRIRTEHLDCS